MGNNADSDDDGDGVQDISDRSIDPDEYADTDSMVLAIILTVISMVTALKVTTMHSSRYSQSAILMLTVSAVTQMTTMMVMV